MRKGTNEDQWDVGTKSPVQGRMLKCLILPSAVPKEARNQDFQEMAVALGCI